MSGEGTHSVPDYGSHGRTNPGFDHPLGAAGTSSSHGGDPEKTDWPKKANEMMEDFLSRCPGAHGGNEQPSSMAQATEHDNTLVSYLTVYSHDN